MNDPSISICVFCKWHVCVEKYVQYSVYECEEGSDNYLTHDGCYHYEEFEDE